MVYYFKNQGVYAMFYVREAVNDAVTITVEISDENVFGICPGCGCEVCVDLGEILSDGESDLYSTRVYCESCNPLGKE